MGTSLGFTQPGQHLQRQQRGYTEAFTDQHGRHFGAHFDRGNLKPIGEFTPIGHNPPWLPPMRFIVWASDGFDFRWDYETMANELAADAAAYYDDVAKFMLDHLPNETVPEVGDPVPKRVRQVLGPPTLSPAIPLAAAAGDPWILGVPGTPVNDTLKACLSQNGNVGGREAIELIKARLQRQITNPVPTKPAESFDDARVVAKPKSIDDVDLSQIANVTYQEFIGQAMKGGLSMADAALAWKAHKENLSNLAGDAA